MHEVSVARSIIEIVAEQCRKSGYHHIEAVNIRIGRASGIMPDALLFAFDALKEESPARGAVLNIEEVPLSGLCSVCGGNFSVGDDFVLACPLCGGTSFNITGGREMDIVDMEVTE